ncbi:Sirohydrochlorin cobaltochelatase [compost metagenome]
MDRGFFIGVEGMKKAILITSFGTSHLDTLDKTIVVIEKEVEEKYKNEYDVFRAFTSHMIIKSLKDKYDMNVMTPEEALKNLKLCGYDEVVVQPLHIIPGEEYDYIKRVVNSYKESFKNLIIGRPLLYFQSEEVNLDYDDLIDELKKVMPKGENVLLVGHGTNHPASACYGCLQNRFRELDYDNAFVGTVEGYPSIEGVIKTLKKYNVKEINLTPFLLVAGDHAKNDIFSEEEESWYLRLKKEGIEVKKIFKGLGEYKEIRNIYLRHLEEAISGKYEGMGESKKGIMN